MGTRSLTHIHHVEDGEEHILLTIYRQYDGYPSGHGKDLAEFLKDRKLVNGFSESTPKISNGAGCLAASLVRSLKEDGPGNVYIYPPGSTDCGEEFTYHIHLKEPKGFGKDRTEGVIRVVVMSGGTKLFAGTPSEFIGFCDNDS